jgi:dTDP-4-dehydrorhamnose 3,5-epimerase
MVLRGEPQSDERGSFWRILDVDALRELGVDPHISQVSSVTNLRRGTVRGLHYQAEPYAEAKTLWCSAGAVYDVLVDIRRDEPTYGQWCGIKLSENDAVAVHIPRGVAHGYQTLADESSLTYLISAPYHEGSARSLFWRDPHIGIEWPLEVSTISARDREAPAWPPKS